VKVIGPLGADPPVNAAEIEEAEIGLPAKAPPSGPLADRSAVVGAAVRSRPCWCPELSVYSPTAVQLPGVAQDTERSRTSGSAPAFNGNVA
jgi:hypothetical protein